MTACWWILQKTSTHFCQSSAWSRSSLPPRKLPPLPSPFSSSSRFPRLLLYTHRGQSEAAL
eukprot:768466-Hanusia_phi.AAC.8